MPIRALLPASHRRRADHQLPVCESEHERRITSSPAITPFWNWPPTTATPTTMACWSRCASDLPRDLAYGISYTWSQNFSDFVDNLTGGSTPPNAYNYSLERGFSPFDRNASLCGQRSLEPADREGRHGSEQRRLGKPADRRLATERHRHAANRHAFYRDGAGQELYRRNHQSRANCIANPFVGATTDPSQIAGAAAPGFFLNPAAFAVTDAGHLRQLRAARVPRTRTRERRLEHLQAVPDSRSDGGWSSAANSSMRSIMRTSRIPAPAYAPRRSWVRSAKSSTP